MHHQRTVQLGARLELCQESIHIVDVLGALDFGDHDHIEPITDLGHQSGEVIEGPW